jgi:hypothetical protein
MVELADRQIPFDQIKGVYLRGLPSRRIGIGLLLSDEDWPLISYVSNNEMTRAAANAEQIAEVVAQAGAGFKAASRSYPWQRVLMGQPFDFRFP